MWYNVPMKYQVFSPIAVIDADRQNAIISAFESRIANLDSIIHKGK
jgi:hypothetical protein